MFSSVKDKNNLLSFNQWSCTEYTNNTSDFVKGGGISFESSNEYSSIGDKSLKSIRSGDTSNWYGLNYDSSLLSKDIKLSGNVKTEGSSIKINFLESNNGTTVHTESVNIPADTTQSFEITCTTGNENTSFVIQIIVNTAEGIVYLDNLKLEIQ